MTRPLVIGTRGSRLALWQAEWVAAQLGGEPACVSLEIIRTAGDRDVDADLTTSPEKGAFTRDIEVALLEGRIDLAVHSLKDLPTTLPEGLVLGAIPPRADVGDVLLVREAALDDTQPLGLRAGARVGTSSPRRLALLQHAAPQVASAGNFRGNVPTRVRKCIDGVVDAVILARAGLSRLGLDVAPLHAFDLTPSLWLPAPGQAALAIETRDGDTDVLTRVASLHDAQTAGCVDLERGLLARLGAGCHAALGAWARIEAGALRLSTGALADDGTWRAMDLDGDATTLVERAASRLSGALSPPREARWFEPARPWN